jgi:hypothetical protein
MKLAYMGWRHRLTPRKSREQATTSPRPAINFAIRRPPCTQKKRSQKLSDYLRAKQNVKNEKKSVLRIRDVYPRSRILIFVHPGFRIQNQQQKRRVKKNFSVPPFYVATNITKINKNIFLAL